MSSIRLHPTAGVNPKLGICMFCRRETGDILLPGAAVKDTESRYMVSSPWPCATCMAEAKEKDAIMLIEGEREERDPKTGKKNVWGVRTTGRLFGVNRGFIERNFARDDKLRKATLEKGFALVDPPAFQALHNEFQAAGIIDKDGKIL